MLFMQLQIDMPALKEHKSSKVPNIRPEGATVKARGAEPPIAMQINDDLPSPPANGVELSYSSNSRPESHYLHMFKASPRERIDIIRKGVPTEMLASIRSDMGIPKERLLAILRFPRTTINRRISKMDALPPEFSERMIGLQKLIGQVESIVADSSADQDFNAARWVALWLEQPLPALGNAKPADYMDTIEGQELVASLVTKMQSGAYA